MPSYPPELKRALDRLERVKREAGADTRRAPAADDPGYQDAAGFIVEGIGLTVEEGLAAQDCAQRAVISIESNYEGRELNLATMLPGLWFDGFLTGVLFGEERARGR